MRGTSTGATFLPEMLSSLHIGVQVNLAPNSTQDLLETLPFCHWYPRDEVSIKSRSSVFPEIKGAREICGV